MEPTHDDDTGTRRRDLLKLAAVGAAGAAVATVASAEPAAAAGTFSWGATNTNATTTPTVLNSTAAIVGAQVLFQSGDADAPSQSAFNAALAGWASSDGSAVVGVYGSTEKAGGSSLVGQGLASAANLELVPVGSTVPSSGTYRRGQFVSRTDGVWVCVTGGSPGTWRKVAGSGTGGSFHPITPTRVFDSRFSTPLSPGNPKTVGVDAGRDANGNVIANDVVPTGATAIVVNVTITATVGSGFAVVFPGGEPKPVASTINWTSSGQTVANQITVGISPNRLVSMDSGGGGASTHVILDVSGYYR